MIDLLKTLIENVSLWEITLLLCVLWVGKNPQYLKMIGTIKVGDLEIKMREMEKELANRKDQIEELEQEIENDRRLFGTLLDGFDANASLDELAKTRDLIKANAQTITDLDELAEYLQAGASAEALYAAAVTLRERRPTQLFTPLIDCLDRLAGDDELQGIRLNTVWTLASAAHRMLIAAIRDKVQPAIDTAELRRAKRVLKHLEQNPRVQGDRPESPERGVRGPIKYALSWIDKAA